jgi:hypothetical protein
MRPPYAAPLRADFGAVRARPSDTVVRDIVTAARTRLGVATAPSDGTLRTRGASTPAQTSVTGWAADLAFTTVADLVVGDVALGPVVAAQELFRRALQLKFGHFAAITVPTIVNSASGIGFIAEDQAIPVRRYLFQGAKLTPQKLPIAVAISNEMYLTPNAGLYVRTGMSEGLAADLDPILLDTNPATAIRPAGLRAGVAGLTPTAGGGDAALVADFTALITAIKPVAGSQIAVVCSPDNFLKLTMRPQSNFPYPFLESSGLPAKTVLAVATNALAVAFGDEPTFKISDSATFHMEDTTPQQLVAAGTPPVVAAPQTSLFQTDSLGLRLILPMSWCLRVAGAVAWVSGTTW